MRSRLNNKLLSALATGLEGTTRARLEQAESLEQLRVLERGLRIRVVETGRGRGTFAIDTPEGLARANAYLADQRGIRHDG